MCLRLFFVLPVLHGVLDLASEAIERLYVWEMEMHVRTTSWKRFHGVLVPLVADDFGVLVMMELTVNQARGI